MNGPLPGDMPEQAGLRAGGQAKGGRKPKRFLGFHHDLTQAAEALLFETEFRFVP